IIATLLVLLLARRKQLSVTLSGVTIAINTAAVIYALWSADDILAREPRIWVPFQPHKLSVLVVALVAPVPAWAGLGSIAAYTAAATAQYLGFPPGVQEHLPIAEPWATLAFGVFALGLYLYRERAMRIERDWARAQAESRALDRLARIGLAVRDLSNTPLQTL